MEYESGKEFLDSDNDEQQLPVQEGAYYYDDAAHDDAAATRESTDSEALPAERCRYHNGSILF